MAELQWTVEGRRFRNAEEYEAALRDKQLIASITQNISLDKPEDIEKLYQELKRGKYRFESIVGRQFDDNIFELYQRMKRAEAEKLAQKEAKTLQRKQKLQKVKRAVSLEEKRKQKEASKHHQLRFEQLEPELQKEILLTLHKREKKRKMLKAACCVICLICFGYFIFYFQTTYKSMHEFEVLAAMKETSESKSLTPGQVTIHRTQVPLADSLPILPEYEALLQKNQRLIGWIKIEDTTIDYPVMQTVNNEYYLNHNFNQEEDKNGCIFMDYQCDAMNGCDNMILYGHHMQSGKMFGSLTKYTSQSYYEDHSRILFDTIYEKGEYEVMYVFRSRVYSEEEVTFKYYQFINAISEQEFNSYMQEMQALSLYDTGVTAVYGDKLLTLSTCDYQENDGRFVVVAKRVK